MNVSLATGSSSGIGEAIALAFGEAGADVVPTTLSRTRTLH